ncbi:MAG: hypothetical protein K6F73_07450 [Lachnospiraceae bacterium]|nr:hypothetical protein [Lachnospiraceae bacterium]
MKIKVLKTFVSGRVSGTKGEIINVPEAKANKLAAIGFAEKIITPKASVAPVQPEPEPEEIPEATPKKKTAAKPRKTKK